MRKKIILRLSILTVFLTLLWSCHNEDFAKGETEPQRNNANFFKHTTSSTNAKTGVDYVEILEAYNREKDFLTAMPDQKGMPIWDKMQVLDISDKTILYVPLSADETELSSLLIVKLDENNSVFHVQDFTNDYLKAYVYNANYPKENRKLLMDTFLQMDFFTFGHQEFTNLPKDLYEGSTEYNRLNIMDAKKGTEQNKMFIYTTVCTTYHYCVHGQSASICDYANCNCGGLIHCFLVTSCSTTATWIDDDPFPSGGGGGGGGGSGGGGGTPGPQPPKDPCSLNTVFYRLAPGCGTGTGTTDVPELDDPCAKAKPSIDKANEILHKPTIQQQMDVVLKGKADLPNEWAMAVGYNYATGEYPVEGPAEGGPSESTPPAGNLGDKYIADGHTHAKKRGSPSAGDLFGILELSQANYLNFRQRYVYGILNGEVEIYALVVTDKDLAGDFLANFSKDKNYDTTTHWFKKDTDLWRDANKITTLYRQNNISNTSSENHNEWALSMAYILDKHNTGISLAKVDANGDLKRVNVTIEPTTTNGFPDEKIVASKCP